MSIQLSRTRDGEIQSCFNCDPSFCYPQTLETFDDLLEDFKLKKSNDNTDSINGNNNSYEEKKIKRMIVLLL